MSKFSDIIQDKSGGNQKLPQNCYLPQGQFPVVDQSKKFIAGYINDKNYLVKSTDLPVIVFGDHTKAIKFIDFPFVMGADGTKILKPNSKCDTKYLYHYLRYAPIPDAGYSRHYKFLKELVIPIPPLPTQRRIVAILDKADELRQKRQQAIEKLDELLQAAFIDMFGDPMINPHGWTIGCIGDMLESVKYGSSDKASLEGEIPILRMNNLTYSGEMDLNNLKYITTAQANEKYLVKEGDILFNRTNSKELVGKTAVYSGPEPMAYAGYLVRGRTKANFAPEYISAFLNSPWGKEKLQSMCKSIVGMANINAKEFQSILLPIPPEHLQAKFKVSVLAIREQKQILKNQLRAFDALFQSLQNQAFNGTL